MVLPIISIVVTVALLLLIGFAVSTLIQLKRTLRNADSFIGNVDERLMPLLSDLHEAVLKVNTELDQIDEIVVNVRDIGDKVNTTTRVVHEIISSPLIRVSSVSAGAKAAIKKLVARKSTEA